MPLFRNEDAAVKAKLQGLSVQDVNADARPVGVRFRNPEDELADQSFPLIVLDHVDTSFDPARAHAGYVQLPYAPEGFRPFPQAPDSRHSPYWTEFPLPLFVDYNVTLLTRKAAHMAQLLAALTTFDYLSPRFGYLVVPQDNTVRRLDVTGGPATDTVLDREGKRLFRAVWRIRTTAELIWAPVDEPVRATAIDLTVTPIGASPE
jgi:hypothetical protein